MATPPSATGYTVAELEEQRRQYELLKGASDAAKNLQDLMRSLNDSEAIGKFRASLTKDLEDITKAFNANEAAARTYVDELFKKLNEGQLKARTNINMMRDALGESFTNIARNIEDVDSAIAGVINGGTIDDLKTKLESLDFKNVTATTDELEKFTKTILEVNNALVDDTRSAEENIIAIKERGIATEEFIDKLKREVAGITDLKEANNKLLETLVEYRAVDGDLEQLNRRAKEQKIQDILLLAQMTANQKKENDELAKKAELETRIGQLTEISNKSRAAATAGFSDLAEKILGSSKNTNLFTSSLLTMISNIDPAQSGIKNLGSAIKDGLLGNLFSLEGSLQRVVGLINDKLIKSTFNAGEAFAKLNRETGGVAQGMSKSGVQQFAAPELAAYGINLDKYLEAQGRLINNFTKFNTLSVDQQRILAASAAKMESLGLSADQYGKLATGLYTATNKGATALAETIDKMGRDAIAMGIGVGNYLNQFAGTIGRITGYGREASQIFKELAGFAKATGDALSAADLAQFTDQFNNFDGAAESLSKLNAVMGGTSLNVLELQKMDPGERIMAIKRAADESGLSFDKLNIGYKRLLAESFGGDIQKTAAFFNLSLEEAYNMMDKTSASAKELEARQKASTSAQEKLSKAIDNMRVVFSPMLELVGKFGDMLIAIQQKVGPGGSVAIAFIALTGIVVGVWTAFKFAAKSAFREITTELQLLNANLAATGNMISTMRGAAAAGAAGPLAGTVTTPKGAGLAGAITTIAGLAIGGAIMASAAKSNEQQNSAFTNIAEMPEAPSANDLIFNPKTGEAMRADSGAPIFITPDGQPIALSPQDSVVASKPGGGSIPQINNSTSNKNISTVEQTANKSYTAIATAVSSLKTSMQEAFYNIVGPSLGQNFVSAISNAVSSGDQNIKNIFNGGRGDVSVHVTMDGDPIAHKIVTKHGDALTNKVFGDVSMVS